MLRDAAFLLAMMAFVVSCCGPGKDRPVGKPDAAASEESVPPPDPLEELFEFLPEAPDGEPKEKDIWKLVELSLGCVEKEYPNKPSNVMGSQKDVASPREMHPAFYGCFDWHSAVHGHWAMAKTLELKPPPEIAERIRAALSESLTKEKLAAELAYFEKPHAKTFERPYGWAWFLRLVSQVNGMQGPEAKKWKEALAPLAALLEQRVVEYLENLSVPVRAGTHASTAFAMVHIRDYAVASGRKELIAKLDDRAVSFYGTDESCPTSYEPSGEDFISPCLVEAELMARVYPPEEFGQWLNSFLPPLHSEEFAPLREPPAVKDPEDPRIGHLIGLSFQRAASFEHIAAKLPGDDPRSRIMRRLAQTHRTDAFKKMNSSGYGGAHWLATFAIYDLTTGRSVNQ